METLTKKQKIFFEKLKESYSNRALASYEVLKNEFNFKSKNSIKQYIEVLVKKNFITIIDNKFYINKNFLGAPLCSTAIKAGFASFIEDRIEKRVSFDEIMNLNSPSAFIFKVSGDSMMDIGIFEGDYVVVKKQPEAKINDIVLAELDGEYTLKTYKKDNLGYYLKAENDNYPIFRPKQSLKIFGVATGILRKF